MIILKENTRLQTTLDRLPYGDEIVSEDLKVTKNLPDGVKSKELYQDIIRIAWPSFIELLLTQLASMVDLMMVGSMGGKANPEIGTQALAAVGLTTQPKFLLMTAFIAMNTGVTALIARNKGTNDSKQANLVVRQGLLFTFCATIILSILGYLFAKPMVLFMGSTEEIVTKWATQYLQIQMNQQTNHDNYCQILFFLFPYYIPLLDLINFLVYLYLNYLKYLAFLCI